MSKTFFKYFCRETEIETKNKKYHSFVLRMGDMGFFMFPGVLPTIHHQISFRIKSDYRFVYIFSVKPWMHINNDEGDFACIVYFVWTILHLFVSFLLTSIHFYTEYFISKYLQNQLCSHLSMFFVTSSIDMLAISFQHIFKTDDNCFCR